MALYKTWSMYLAHFVASTLFLQNFLMSSISSCFDRGLFPGSIVRFSIGFRSGLSGGWPPVDPILLKEGFGCSRSLLRVIVLHEAVIRELHIDERHQMAFEDITVKVSRHDSFKDAYFRPTLSAYSSPHDRAPKRLDMRNMSQAFTRHPSRHSIFKLADDESKTNTSLSWFLSWFF